MKIYPLMSTQVFHLAGLAQAVFLFLMLPLATVCFGAPATNTFFPTAWTDNFETYASNTALINGTNGWYSSPGIYDTNFPPQTSSVHYGVSHSGTQAAMVAIGDTLSNSFWGQPARNVKLEMYIQPQLWTSGVNPLISSAVAAQFFINSNGYFVVGNGNSWNEASNSPAQTITNINNSTNFIRIQVHLQYNTHTWDLKAWTNGILVASTNYLRFASNQNCFSGFVIYNGTTNSYLDDVTVTRFQGPFKINGMSFDTIKRVDGALPDGKINGVNAQ